MNDKSQKLIMLEKILKWMSVLVLKKYKPQIIAITGSVGKTSTKESIYTVLKDAFPTRKNEKNYNNEVGLPLTVIGAESGGSSFGGWLKVFFKWLGIIIFPTSYPKVLILEMGADRPGDITYLTSFIRPHVGIITDISGSHLEYFKTAEGVAKEKGVLVKNLEEKGLAVLNIDNPYLEKIKNQLSGKIMTYGFSELADLQAKDVFYNYSENETQINHQLRGLSFKLSYKGTTMPIRLNNVLAEHQIYPALAAIACGLEFGLNLVEIAKSLEEYYPPVGRMSLIEGIKGTVIIDDTYNASPASTSAALEALKNIKAGRKIAVLGDMLELGPDNISGHKKVAKKFLEVKGDIFIGVGERMKFAVEELINHKIDQNRIFSFANPMDAGRMLQEIIREDDLILVKGSQGMRMEKVVEEVMANPEKATELLCRQSKTWKEKPWRPV